MMRGPVRRLTATLATMRRLSWSDRWLLLQAAFVVTVMSLSLKVVSFQRLRALLFKLGPSVRRSSSGDLQDIAGSRVDDIARFVYLWSKHTPLSNTCLHRSLALWWLLERHGFESQLQFGARKRDGALEAHAWVEHNGVVVSDDQADDFTRLRWMPLKNDA
jgi:hypothetical protein